MKNKKTIEVLYFLDPFTNKTIDRWPTLKLHINELIKKLPKYSKVKINVLTEKSIEALASKEDLNLPIVSFELSEIDKQGDEPISLAIERIKAVTKKIRPDILMLYESDADWIEEVFPNAKIIRESWGLLSRLPFPSMTAYDPLGFYSESVLSIYSEQIKKYSITANEEKVLRSIRAIMVKNLASTDPIFPYADAAHTRFKKLILLPLQLDHHFSFTNCAEWKSHFEMIVNIFEKISKNIGVVVTQHPDHMKVIDEAEIARLKQQYPNFLYFENLDAVPMVSQWWLLHVDAIATISSGLAFQAAIMGIPVIALGSSHINIVSSANLDQINEFIEKESPPKSNINNAIYWIFSHYNVFWDEVLNADLIESHFESMLTLPNPMEMNTENFLKVWPKKYSEKHLATLFNLWFRQDHLKSLLEKRSINLEPNELLVKIADADAVSFDLFDTLVQRPFLEPHDLFMLIEKDIRSITQNSSLHFTKWRRLAEENARKKRNWKEVTLNQIYNEFSIITGYNRKLCNQIADVELKAETHVLTRREPIYRAFKWSLRLGKVVSIISDIYLSKKQINELLSRVGINQYDHLLVSSDLDLRKHDGTIYPYYLKLLRSLYGITQKSDFKNILHVGDNNIADIQQALNHQLRTHWISRNSESLKNSALQIPFKNNIHQRWVNDSVVMGLIANRFSHHLVNSHKDSLFAGSLYAFGYIAGAPMLMAFVQWINHRVKSNKHNKVYFLARDGYILKEIYDKLRSTKAYNQLPDSEYLYLSRRSTALASCENLEDLLELLHLSFSTRQLADFLKSRFGLDSDDININILKKHAFELSDYISHQNDLGRLVGLIKDLKKPILNRALLEREGLKKYLDQFGLFDEGSCFIDIGYSGSIQRYINKICKTRVAGYYMLTHSSSRKLFDDVIIEGWYASFDEQRSCDHHPLNDHVFLFETLLSSTEDSVECHLIDDKKNHYINWIVQHDNPRRIFIKEVHDGIADFAEDFTSQLGDFCSDIEIGNLAGSKVFFHLANEPMKKDAELFLGLGIENSFGGGDASLIFDIAKLSASGYSKSQIELAIGMSQWKQAAACIYLNESEKANSQNYKILSSARNLDVPGYVKKYIKYKKNPYAFFNDSKNIFLRQLRFFYINPNKI